jgi:Flp pilus assembly secretin CpaC
LPWIGDVPVLGALFSSKDYQKNETDLVIVVTPHIVHPMHPGDPVKTPADDTLPANDVDFFLNGKPEVLRTEVRATEAEFDHDKVSGHMLDLPKVEPHSPDPPRPQFQPFDLSTWGWPAQTTGSVQDNTTRAAAKSTPDVPAQPAVQSAVAETPNRESQILDLPKGDSHATAQ